MEARVDRRVLSLSQPEAPYNQQELAAVVANSLSATSPLRNFLLLASPGSGSSTLIRELQGLIASLASSAPNFIHLEASPIAHSIFPYTIRSIASAYLERPLLYLDAFWKSLASRQKLTYLVLYGLSILALNYATIWTSAWGAGKPISWQVVSLKSIFSFGLVTAIGTALPAAVLTYWRSLWRHLSEEDLKHRGEELISIFRRNKYRALTSVFRKRFMGTFGPVLLVLDSIDDLEGSFDNEFVFDYLIPMLARRHRLVVLGVSKLPTEARLRFQERISSLDLFMLEPPRSTGLSVVGLAEADASVSRQEPPVESPRSRAFRQSIIQLAESETYDNVNVWTLLCILAASPHFERRGFTLPSLDHTFQAQIALLNKMFSGDGGIGETTTSQVQDTLRQLLRVDMTRNLFIFNQLERKYFWDYAARQQVIANSPLRWRLIGRAFWLAALFDEMQQVPAPWTCFDAAQVAKRLITEVAQAKGQEQTLSEIALLAAHIVAQTSRTAYADLRESCCILYFVARSLSSLSQEVMAEDAICLSALVIYGRTRADDLASLGQLVAKSGNPSPLVLLATRSLTVGEEVPDQDQFSFASLPEGDFKSLVRWLYANCLRRQSVLPMLLLEEVDVEWSHYARTLPQVVGGFNLATHSALILASDANQLHQDEIFLHAWMSLAQGVLKLGQLSPTAWEHIWIEFVSTALASEMVIFLAGYGRPAIYDHEGLRHDIGLQSLTPEQMQALVQIAAIISVGIPKDQTSVLPISVLRSLSEAIEDVRVKLLLLSLRDMANFLVCLRSRLALHTSNLDDVQKNVREDLVAELHRISSISPPLARITYRSEALVALHQIDSSVHKSLGADSLVYLLKEFDKESCPQRLIDLVYEKYIHELRFSHSRESLRLAARLLLRRLKNNGTLGRLQVARLYCKLSVDMLKLGRRRGAEECWRRAKRSFDEFTEPLNDKEVVKLFRDTEILLFVERVRIQDDSGRGVTRGIERFLRNPLYSHEPGHSYLQLLWLASGELPAEKLDLLIEAIERVEIVDWYAGYIWALLLGRLYNRMLADQRCRSVAERVIPILIAKIGRSDQSGIDLQNAVDTFRQLYGSSLILASTREFADVYESLMTRKATVSFGEALTLWMEGGTLGEVAFSYYRLVQPYVEQWLPQEVRVWSFQDDYVSFREDGWKLLSKYAGISDTSWLAIYIAGLLERRGKKERDGQLEVRLQGIWIQLGVRCIESLLKATIGSAALPASLRIILRSQMEEFGRNRKGVQDAEPAALLQPGS